MKRYCLLACLLGCGVTEPVMVQQRSVEALNPFADLTCGSPTLPGGLTAEHFDALPIQTFEQLIAEHEIQLSAVQEDGLRRGIAEIALVPLTYPVIHPNGVLELPFSFKEQISDYVAWARENSDLPDDLLRFEALVVHQGFQPDKASQQALRDRYLQAIGSEGVGPTTRRRSTHEREMLRCSAGCRVECQLVAIHASPARTSTRVVNNPSECKAAGPETAECPHLPAFYGSAHASEGLTYASCSGRFHTLPAGWVNPPTNFTREDCQRVICNRGDVAVTPNEAKSECMRSANVQTECTYRGSCEGKRLQMLGQDIGRLQPSAETTKNYSALRRNSVTPAAKALAEVEMVSNWGTGQAGEAGPMKVVAEIQPDKNEAREACGGELPDEVARECPDGAISQNCYFDVNGSVSTSSLPGVTVSAGCTISAPPECLAALIEHCLFGDYSSPADGYSKSKEDFDITLVNSAGLSLSGGVSLLDNYSEEGGTIEITVSRLPMHAKTEMTTTAPADRCLLAQEVETVTGTDIFTFLNGTTTTAKASSKARVERHIHRVYIPGSNNNISATIIGPKIDSRENTEVTAVGQGVALTCGGGGAIGGGVGVERPDQTTPPVNTDQPICLKDNDCGTHGSICVCRDADGAVVNDAVSCSGCECEVGCRTEGDCELGERCMDGVCIVPECIEDAECGPGMRCDEEICVPDPCEDSSDCADGEYCHEGDCHPQLTNCSACDEAVVNQCGEVDDGGPQFCHLGRCRWLECDDQHPCCDGETCDGGDCVADPQPGCVENTDCPDGEICMAGACEPPECSDGNPCPEDQLCTDFRCVLGEAGECDVPGAPVCPNNGCCRTNICHDQGSPDCQNP